MMALFLHYVVKTLLVAMVAAAGPASAATLASASITQLGYQLIDLAPNDGMAPGISFADSTYYTSFGFTEGGVRGFRETRNAGDLAFTTAQVGIDAGASDSAVHLRLELFRAEPFADASAGAQVRRQFTLAPHTAVLFTASGAIDDPDPGGHVRANFSGRMTSAGSSFRDTLDVVQGGALSRQMYGYLHSGELPASGSIVLETLGYAFNMPPPVPEPGTMSLLLAGLGVLAIWAMRRRSPDGHSCVRIARHVAQRLRTHPDRRRGAIGALALGALTCAWPAYAETTSSSSAELSALSYRLIDLAPDDGIAPHLSFGDELFETIALKENYDPVSSVGHTAGTSAISLPSGRASATASDGPLSATAYFRRAPGTRDFMGRVSHWMEFTLAPNTGVLFTAQFSAVNAFDPSRAAFAAAGLNLWFYPTSGTATSALFTNDVTFVEAGSHDYQLSTFAYSDASGGFGQLFRYVIAEAIDPNPLPIPAVPEPDSIAMLLAGLAILGGLRARLNPHVTS